jgi:regulator of protease activity HflC (stomatin/prohibitin superfamily)
MINQKFQKLTDHQTEAWGIKITAVGVKDGPALPDSMKPAMPQWRKTNPYRTARKQT